MGNKYVIEIWQWLKKNYITGQIIHYFVIENVIEFKYFGVSILPFPKPEPELRMFLLDTPNRF